MSNCQGNAERCSNEGLLRAPQGTHECHHPRGEFHDFIARIAATAAVTGIALTGTVAVASTADASTAKAACGNMAVTTPIKVNNKTVKAHVKATACSGWTYGAKLQVGRWYGWSTIDSTEQHTKLNGWLHGGCRKGTYTYRVQLWAYSAVYNHAIQKTKRLTCH